MNEQVIKRLKSFIWRFLCVALIAGISWTLQNLGLLDVPIWLQGLLGLILGEISKWLNNHTALFGTRLK